MKDLTERFKKIIEPIIKNVVVYESAPSSDFTEILHYLNDKKNKISKDYQGKELILNITGGNKLMILGAWNSFRPVMHKIIYADTAKNQIEYLPVNDNETNNKILMKPVHSPNDLQKEFLQFFNDSGLIEWDGNQSVIFKNYDSARYLGGLWLEEYVYDCVSLLKPDDVRNSVEISRGKNSEVPNELDVLVVHNNRLLVVECKTLRMDKGKETDIIYKLDSLGNGLKGLFGSALLVSAQNPNNQIKNRLKELKMGFVCPANLSNIKNYIKNWMETGKIQ